MEDTSLVAGSFRRSPSILASKLDLRGVCALRQINANGIVLAVGLVVFAKPVSQSRGLHANNGVNGGVKGLGTIEDL